MMTRHIRQTTMLVASLIAATFFVTSCARRPATVAAASVAAPTSTPAPTATTPADRSAERVVALAPSPPPPTGTSRPPVSDFSAQPALQDVHFDFDKYDIRAGDAAILDGHARWLKSHASDLVLIEGHADERGTNEYNLALGDRRAKATMNYLVSRGVRAERITVISYGEERPLCIEHEASCWAKNRRAHFMVNVR